MKHLILAHQNDTTAMRVYANLVARHNTNEVSIVTDEELVFAKSWRHEIASGYKQTIIQLNSGRLLNNEKIGIVFNRLRGSPMPHFEHAKKADREYAQMEMYALFLSWLFSIPGIVINAASPQGLGARDYSLYKWLALGAQAGLPVQEYHFTSNSRRYYQSGFEPWKLESGHEHRLDNKNHLKPHILSRQPVVYLEPDPIHTSRVLVIGNKVIGDIDKQHNEACVALARRANCEILQLDFGLFEHNWKLMAVDAFPTVSDSIEIEAIVSFMENNTLKDKLS